MILLVGLIFTAGWSLAASHPSHYLRVDLFGDYDKLTRPNHQVKVKLRHSLTRLAVDPIKEELTVDGWLSLSWFDERLTWNASKWDFISTEALRVPYKELWIPDISIYNSVGRMQLNQLPELNRALIYKDGKVLWVPQVTYTSTCQVNETEWLNGQALGCKVKIGSWTEHGGLLSIKPGQENDDPNTNGNSIEWDYYTTKKVEIINSSITYHEKKYSCCEEVYPNLSLNLNLRRDYRP